MSSTERDENSYFRIPGITMGIGMSQSAFLRVGTFKIDRRRPSVQYFLPRRHARGRRIFQRYAKKMGSIESMSSTTIDRNTIDTDVLVIDGGIGRLMAAVSAAEQGVGVIVAEEANTKGSGCGATENDHFQCYIPEVHRNAQPYGGGGYQFPKTPG
jgi:hypothetical protein